ncbi:uncharacterized protein [Coffea arabica]|uniref:Uncharacterized protein LOC113704248 isoform X1 n=1 Tax=Coffea arabica TaxID=13443 RepID=A0A6P6TVT5_COFAR|nr:uncharacterized protein LOC113704248 isoform X1 [Coffea arabica]XP_027081832.1 uncharacterized protein LOC113704248 isoform X1 [Coffea arabica]XP_027081833.1 uncharacterized protein LOC113704248 isoform X1 [Coffea arabica]
MNPETTVNRCHYQWHNFLTTSFLENYFGFFTPFSQFPTVLVFHAFCSAIPFNKCKSSNSEWQVLYTTQVTQKAKKYHDGFLQLLTCGSSCKQVLLYDETRRLLESRFLKKDEIIRSGESIAFDGHLVDIGECEEDHKPPIDSNIRKTNCNMDGQKKAACGPLHSLNQLPTGENEALARKQMTSNFKGSIDESNIFAEEVSKNPIRAAHEILSILRKAKSEKDVATMKSLSIEGFHASESTSFFQSDSSCQRKEQLQDVCNEGSTTIHLDEENSPMQKDDSEISKDEATNEIHLVEISKSAEKGSENSPSFFLGSETTNLVNHMVDTDHTESSRRYLDTPVLEPEDLATVKLELKTPITSVLQDTSMGDLKSRNCTQQVFCKENSTGGTAAAASGSDTSQVIAEPKHEKLPQPCVDSKEIDTRWQNGVHFIDLATSSNSTPREVADDQNISEQDISSKRTDEFPSFELGF